MEIKIGDFGLATKLEHDGERKKTICGTNYIAPEILSKKGHSFEVDAWSLGCIMYTLLAGRPPFETSCLKDTYALIKKTEYHVPSQIPKTAKTLICKLLQGFQFPVFPPRQGSMTVCGTSGKNIADLNKAAAKVVVKAYPKKEVTKDMPNEYHLTDLLNILQTVVDSKPSEKSLISEEDAEDPASVPVFWVSKWVDYTDKYGLGYQLCDNSVGVLFNDNTRIIQLEDGFHVHYIDKDMNENYHTMKEYPDSLTKKVTLLNYFKDYMNEHLLKAGETVQPRDGDEFIRLPYLRALFRTRMAIVMHLTNGTLQLNFFNDHTKIIVSFDASSYVYQRKERI